MHGGEPDADNPAPLAIKRPEDPPRPDEHPLQGTLACALAVWMKALGVSVTSKRIKRGQPGRGHASVHGEGASQAKAEPELDAQAEPNQFGEAPGYRPSSVPVSGCLYDSHLLCVHPTPMHHDVRKSRSDLVQVSSAQVQLGRPDILK